MIQSILATVGLPILVEFIQSALTKIDTPVTRGAAEALHKVDEALKAGTISTEQISEANRHIEKLAELESKNSQITLSEINETIRSEIASKDKFVRRMRPTFGYIMALTWAAQMFGIAYIIIFDTARAGVVLAAMSSLTAIWGIGLSVLGIYVYKRSEDKKLFPNKETIFWNEKI